MEYNAVPKRLSQYAICTYVRFVYDAVFRLYGKLELGFFLIYVSRDAKVSAY